MEYSIQRGNGIGTLLTDPARPLTKLNVNIAGTLYVRLSDGAKQVTGTIYLNGWYVASKEQYVGIVVYQNLDFMVFSKPEKYVEINGQFYRTLTARTGEIYYSYQTAHRTTGVVTAHREYGVIEAVLYEPVTPNPANVRGLVSFKAKPIGGTRTELMLPPTLFSTGLVVMDDAPITRTIT